MARALIDGRYTTPEHPGSAAAGLLPRSHRRGSAVVDSMALLTAGYWRWDQPPLTQMGWFLSQGALAWTFRCAISPVLLPYHLSRPVGLLRLADPDAEMIFTAWRGRGQSGPLIIGGFAFVAFVGAYVQALFGPDIACFVAGCGSGGCWVTWFHLPAFLHSFIAGGPSSNRPMATAAFTAPRYRGRITQPVVGIVSQPWPCSSPTTVLWPMGLAGRSTGYRH